MSICVITHPVGPTATATSGVLNILSELTDVSLISANVSDRSEIRKDHEVIEVSKAGTGSSIPVAATRFVANQIRMCRVLQTRDEEIVWFFGATAYLLPILFAKLLGKTVVIQPRGDVPLTLKLHWEQRVPDIVAHLLAGAVRLLEKVGYHVADRIVTYTPTMATELGLNRYEEKLYTNGARYVDADQFYQQTEYTDRDQVVGFLGRLDEEKRIRELASVARQLPDNIIFVFAGDGELRSWLEAELADEIEAGSVEVMGWVDREEVPKVLNRFRLLVLPSQPTEGLPTVILEAFACGTPVYATPVSGITDVLQDETGFLIGDTDATTIAQEIERILAQEDLETISRNGRKLVESKYSFEEAVKRWENIIRTFT